VSVVPEVIDKGKAHDITLRPTGFGMGAGHACPISGRVKNEMSARMVHSHLDPIVRRVHGILASCPDTARSFARRRGREALVCPNSPPADRHNFAHVRQGRVAQCRERRPPSHRVGGLPTRTCSAQSDDPDFGSRVDSAENVPVDDSPAAVQLSSVPLTQVGSWDRAAHPPLPTMSTMHQRFVALLMCLSVRSASRNSKAPTHQYASIMRSRSPFF